MSNNELTRDLPGAGALYIKGERDRITGKETPYFKVGIVRGDKEARDRDGALSTGNPRDITNLLELTTPYVQKLETRLHNEFAFARVSSNEWFHSDLCSVERVRDKARELHAQIENALEALLVVESYTAEGPAPKVAASDEVEELAQRLASIEGDRKAISGVKKAADKALSNLAQADEKLWQVFFKRSERAESSTFSAMEVKKRYPELYSAFVTPTEGKPRRTLSLPDVTIDITSRLDHWSLPTAEAIAEISEDAEALHRVYLSAWAADSIAEWESWILEATLVQHAAGSEGIEGLLEWKTSTSNTFNKEAFIESHPELVDECTVFKPATTTYAVQEWVATTAEGRDI